MSCGQAAIDLFESRHDRLDRKSASHLISCGFPEPALKFLVANEPFDRLRELMWSTGRHEDPADAVRELLWHSTDFRRNDRQPGRHGLEDVVWKTLGVRGVDECPLPKKS